MTKKELVKSDEKSIQSALIDIVGRKDIDPERLQRFLEIQIQMEDRQAKKAFYNALADFQGECPPIPKTKKVQFKNVNYSYSPLDEIVEFTRKLRKQYGLSFSFNTLVGEGGLEILVTRIAHSDGYSELSELRFSAVLSSAGMNAAQERKSALSYIKRAGLENALGITTSDDDSDGRSFEPEMCEEEREAKLLQVRQLMEKTDTNEEQFAKYLKVETIEGMGDSFLRKAIIDLKHKLSLMEES